MSDYRCVSDSSSRGRELDPSPVSYFQVGILKKSADENKSMINYPACNEITPFQPNCYELTPFQPNCYELTPFQPNCYELTPFQPNCYELTPFQPNCYELTPFQPNCFVLNAFNVCCRYSSVIQTSFLSWSWKQSLWTRIRLILREQFI